MNLIMSLRRFDGKRTADLERLSLSMSRSPASVAQLLAFAEHDDTTVQVGATWILKRWLEEGVPEVERSAEDLVELLPHATDWRVQLHVLQMLPSLRISMASLKILTTVLPGLVMHENKFVRAWALSGLVALADQSNELRQDVVSAITDAEDDPAPSVRVRVRQIQKCYTWTTQAGRATR
jgi:HEAT repeat protein